ncbi:MAG: thiamine pyrophosphate-dependent dehydrogenase E1 component subunit alpha, partial [Candidatus Omnitrophica bacterium]|nr:thiamine pyrophosphate-dependent dehydrogenase E1 component subunit alpha [Candidatus Omnitrophota bacterium]
MEKVIEYFRRFLRIRLVELRVESLYHLDEMKTPIHLSIGQEQVAAGICLQLTDQDMIFSNHRSHAHYLAKGGDLKAMIAEFYCKVTGCDHGRGGSMHLIDKRVGHYGSSAIVGGGISHGVGAALASKLLNKNFIAVVFLGDAASEQGVFFESLSLAMLKKVPVLFVCENNRYSVCSPISVRQPNDNIAQRARAFDMPAETIDGMDFNAVYESAQRAVEYCRTNKSPYFLEYKVQRWRGHAGAGDPLRKQYRLPED